MKLSSDRDIPRAIRDLEGAYKCRVLLAIESGSRAWGFASADSDYDVRFIYVRTPEWYLAVSPRRDVIDAQDGDFDAVGWDLRKALLLARQSHPTLLEWLQSPVIYHAVPEAVQRIAEVAAAHAVPRIGVYHYLGWAGRIRNRYLREPPFAYKRYLYVMRPLLCAQWLLQHQSQPPMAMLETLSRVDVPVSVREAVIRLIGAKQSSRELGAGEPDPILDEYINERLHSLKGLGQRPSPLSEDGDPELDHAFHQLLSDAWPLWRLAPAS